jgi:5'-nucleotidase (lipoprotein e(P4) family)
MHRTLVTLILVLALGCATQPPACRPGDALVNAALWVQSAQEYRAASLQTYASARRMLDAALADPTWSALAEQTSAASLPLAIILDADETSIANNTFESRMIKRGITYESEAWKQWVSESAAGQVPGTGEFLAYAKSRGVTPFFITNRRADEEAPTRSNLEKLGYPMEAGIDTLLVRGERKEWDTSDKSGRRSWVASQYRVLLLMGDDLNDFVNAAGKSNSERDALLADTADRWGTKWFMIPNPMYGSWETTVAGRGTPCEQFQRKLDSLK